MSLFARIISFVLDKITIHPRRDEDCIGVRLHYIKPGCKLIKDEPDK